MAEFEATNDREAMRDGLERLARSGKMMPNFTRLGYDWSALIPEGQKGAGHKAPGAVMVVNAQEAELVKLIFDRYENQPAKAALTTWLNEEGYRLPCKMPGHRAKHGRTEKLFTHTDVTNILSDDLYTGMVVWGKPPLCRESSRWLIVITSQSFR
ncbi:MAG TPA: recombinase family protein [Dehalococcoidia bacterium]|nr:recombinase family protein [Dehalococcoidia bacterium]